MIKNICVDNKAEISGCDEPSIPQYITVWKMGEMLLFLWHQGDEQTFDDSRAGP